MKVSLNRALLAGAVLTVSAVSGLQISAHAGDRHHDDSRYDSSCHIELKGDRSNNHAGRSDSRFYFTDNGDKVSIDFTVKGDETCDVTLATWEAPDGEYGMPYDEQVLHDYATGTFSKGTHTLTADAPGCYYQFDLLTSSSPTAKDGTPNYNTNYLEAWANGGEQPCEDEPETPVTPHEPEEPEQPEKPEEPKVPETPEEPEQPKVPETPEAPEKPAEPKGETVVELPKTGLGSTLAQVLGLGTVAAGIQYWRQSRR